jgi:hypothetical protein
MQPIEYGAYVILRPDEFGVMRPFIELKPNSANADFPAYSMRPGSRHYIEDYLDPTLLYQATIQAYSDDSKAVFIQTLMLSQDALEPFQTYRKQK